MNVSISVFESLIILAVTGVFVVAWWGVKRIVKTNDDESKVLTKIHDSLNLICQRLAATDKWMEMHTDMDDERHEENKNVLKELKKSLESLKDFIGGKG